MKKINIGLIGAGRIGSFHGTNVTKHLSNANLVAIADPFRQNAEKLAKELNVDTVYTDAYELINDKNVDAVIIATPARTHTNLVIAAAKAGKDIFCEKPMAVSLSDVNAAIEAVEQNHVKLQIGFNRRFVKEFKAGHDDIVNNKIGTPQLMRSLTRDPGLRDPTPIPEWTIFLETLIHDFDILNYMNPEGNAYEVYAVADALVRPDFKDKGLLDTAVVTIRYDNGAIATAEANFQAVYGYDVRGEVFGSAGMVTMGDVRLSNMTRYTKEGISIDTSRQDSELLFDSYVNELNDFANSIIKDYEPCSTGKDAKNALVIALACIDSIKQKKPVKIVK